MPIKLYVSFSFSGDFDPKVITEALEIDPTKILVRGEKNSELDLPRRSMWSFDLPVREGEAALDGYGAISSVIDVFELKVDEIRQVADSLNAEICLSVAAYLSSDDGESTPAIGFDPRATRFLGAVGASIDIDTFVKERD
jgi:hypothetical protein